MSTSSRPQQNKKVRRFPVRRKLPPQMLQASRFRLVLVWGILMLSGLGLFVNLIRLQVFQGKELHQKAQAQQQIQYSAMLPRRSIVERTGQVVAIDRPVYTLYAHPQLFTMSREALAKALSPILGRSVSDLLQKFVSAESGIEVEFAVNEDTARHIRQAQLDGLELVERSQRFYPQQNLFAEVVGFVNLENQSEVGVEAAYQNLLKTDPQSQTVQLAGDGSLLPIRIQPESELQLHLTLDIRVQRAARKALQQQLSKYKAKRGTAIVLDAQNGEILALATEPNFDANYYYNSKLENLKNWAVSDLFEPGSTFKPINVAIALEAGAITPNSYVYDEGRIIVSGWPIQNSDYTAMGGAGRGSISVAEVLKYSSNVGMVRIMEQMSPVSYYKWLKKLGLESPTGVDLPSETSGQLKSKAEFIGAKVNSATTAFGQGLTLTPLQLAQLHAALANGGYWVTPHVVRGLYDSQGHPHWQPSFQRRQIFKPQTTQAVLEMMETAVADGTGKAAAIPNYRIAGKTGTAQKVNPQGGYYDQARITSFVGILPVAPVQKTNPHRYVVLAVVDEPQGDDAYGGTVSAPIVKPIMETLITIQGIPPGKK